MSSSIRVLIADDHPLFRDGLIALLDEGPGTELVGAATSGIEAVDLARDTQPDVVVMDLHMPVMNGVEATRRIVADNPGITVLVLSMFDDDASVFSALRAGARGYLLKGSDQEQIRCAIAAAAKGEIVFGGHLATRILACFTAVAAPEPADTCSKAPAGTRSAAPSTPPPTASSSSGHRWPRGCSATSPPLPRHGRSSRN